MAAIRGGGTGEFVRYVVISAIALGVDVFILLLLAEIVHYLWAATAGFLIGAVVSYVLAVKWVFRIRRLEDWPKAEFAVYAMTGVLGLGLNNGLIFLAVGGLEAPLILGKGIATTATFLFNYLARKGLLFRK